ncbi:MAG: hypothetical protein WCF93_02185 [Candidatus Moraniibacteriota bacterium]
MSLKISAKKINPKIFRKSISLKGFSLIEVLFSLLVFSIGIVSIVAIMTANIKISVTAKNQIIAAQLIQEGIELVKNLSDNKDGRLVKGNEYLDYTVDTNMSGQASTINFVSAVSHRLYLDDGGKGFYSHTTSTKPTKFARKIYVDWKNNISQITVTSSVSWDNSGDIPATCNVSTKCAMATLIISPHIGP